MILALAGLALASPGDEEGLWSMLAVLGDDPLEVVQCTDQLRDLALAATARVEATDADLDLLRALREEVMELDIGRLYRALPEKVDDGRRLVVQGEWDDPVWRVRVGRAGTAPEGLGALDAAVVMRSTEVPIESAGKAWSADLDGTLQLGPLDHGVMAGLWERGLAEAQRLASEGPAPASGHQPGLVSADDRRMWAGLEAAAPSFAARLSSAVVVDRIGSVTTDGLDLDAQVRVDAQALSRAGYPSLARYLRRLDRVLRGEFRLLDSKGRDVAVFTLDTHDLRMGAAMLADDGAVLPRVAGRPVPEAALRPRDSELDLSLRLDMVVRSDGMQVAITDYVIPLHWRAAAESSDIAVRVTDEPQLELSGTNGFTGFIAQFADSVFDLEGHAQGVFAAVAHGPTGEGTQLTLSHDGQGEVTSTMRAVVIDNAMVRFFMRLVGRHLVPTDAAIADAYAASESLVRALDSDWRPVRERWLASECSVPVE